MARFQETEEAVKTLTPLLASLTNQVNSFAKSLLSVNEASKKTATSQNELKEKSAALSNVDEELIKLDKQMVATEAKLTNEYKQVQKALIAKQEAQKKATAALKEEVTGAKAAAAARKKLNKDHAEAIRINKRLTSEQKRFNQAQEKAIFLNKKFDDDLDKKKKKKKFGDFLKSGVKSLLAYGAAMIGVQTIIRGLANSIKTMISFEKAMSEVKAIAIDTTESIEEQDKQFKALNKSALALGSSTSKTASEVSALQKEFAKLGFSTTEILAATEATISLSIAAGSDLAQSAKVAASTIRGFGLSATETQRVVDVMAKSFSSSALDLAKFETAMAVVAPVAKASGKSIEFATAQLAVLSDAGLDASTAGTSLRNMFLELNKRGLTWEEGLEKIQNSTNKNVTALELFGKRGATAGLILADNTEKSSELEESLLGAEGAAKSMADTMENNLAGDIDKAKSAWEGFVLSLNEGSGAISKSLRFVTKGITGTLQGLKAVDVLMRGAQSWSEEDVARVADLWLAQAEDMDEFHQRMFKIVEKGSKEQIQELIKVSENFTLRDQLVLSELVKRRIAANQLVKQADQDAADAAIETAQDAAGTRSKISAEEAAKNAAEVQKNITRLEKELQEKLALEDKYRKENESEADALLAAEMALNQSELDMMGEQLQKEADLQLEADERYLELLKEKHAEEERLEKEKEDAILTIKEAAYDAAEQIVSDQLTARIDENLAKFQAENDAQQDILKDKLDKELISEEEYEKQSSALKLKSRQEEAKAEKKKALFDIAISTAVALVKQLAATPLPLGAPFLAAAAALGAIQLGVAAAKPVPKFADGEINIAGKRHSQGGIQAEIEQGESVINRTGTFNAPNLLTAINNGMLSDRDILLPASSAMFSGADTKELLKGFESSVINLDPLIAEQRATRKAMQNQGGTKIDQKGLQRFSEHNGTRKKHLDTFFR